jgi:S-adenosylmethionine/arginine decarboxylase-like enzyme
MVLKNNLWGISSTIDLHGCKIELLKDPNVIKKFVKELCAVLKMKRRGPLRIDRFGHGKLEGWSIMQFIETSSIVIHFDENDERVFIDVFSCKNYNPKKISVFSKKFFEAKSVKTNVQNRF